MRIILIVLLLQLCSRSVLGAIITGTVSDRESGEPIPNVTIRVEGTGRSIPANEQGQYRLLLEPGVYSLKFSHVAHFSDYLEVEVGDSSLVLDVTLRPAVVELPGIRVYDRAYDPAQRIIVEAIRHKQEILALLRSYRCQAYVKSVISEKDKDDSTEIGWIVESQIDYLWEPPDRYKEVIVARRQSANIKPNQNIIPIENIPDFNRNRIKFDRYSIISPTATDALKYYNYYLLDTIFVDGKTVFRLEVEPKNETDPLVVGTIDIADSTFNIVGVEGGLGAGVYLPYVKNFRYSQRFAEFESRFWMPIEIHVDFTVNLAFPVERCLSISYVSALSDYTFDYAMPDGTFDYALEIAKDADDVDSVTWNARQMIPLTSEEQRGYERIDSLVNAPKPLYKRALSGLWFLYRSTFNYDYFRFNRVEGAYVGIGQHWWEPLPRMELEIKTGYAFSRKHWQHHYTVAYRLWDRRRIYVGVGYRDEIRHRPVILASPGFNPASWNLFSKADPLDYYLERGIALYVAADLIRKARAWLIYRDYRQSSEVNNTEYSFFDRHKEYRSNPGIVDGKLRSFSTKLKYDSRGRARIKGREAILSSPLYTQLEIGAEVASPDVVDNDFDFVRYYSHLKRTGSSPLPGLTTIEVFVGGSDRTLPPQKYFTVDYTYRFLGEGMFFRTVGENNFAGSRVAALYLANDFGTWFFQQSRLPLIKRIPLSLTLYGGAFWTDFRGHPAQPGDEEVNTASKAYSEIGFGIGRIPPLNLKFTFTWQLSDYDTNNFTTGLGFGL
jgi:hypothetical protein